MRQFLKNLRDIRRYIRRGSAKDVIKVCPICLGDNLEVHLNSFLGFLSPPYYNCHICGYKGAIFAEIERNQYENLKSTTEGNSYLGR
ncbi:MAG: hypothetical protein JSW11_03810 [Candidatus Heimdallarchaeota archaeon]|nr:MAG: hypothetical protein JSW11_03810 [Candidatus Heimdallarchaeota archaeon]